MDRSPMKYQEALEVLAADPAHRDLMRDIYVDGDVRGSAERFVASAEWGELRRFLGTRIDGARVLDVGAGSGMASSAFARSGAREVIALEPEAGGLAGRQAIEELGDPRIRIVDGYGEALPLEAESVDVVYGRQVLHHSHDLDLMLRELARVLKPGGLLVACREHVVDDDAQLQAFLATHPVHRLAGGENAFPLSAYVAAIEAAGLTIRRVLGPWDSIINVFPLARSPQELEVLPARALELRFGAMGRIAARVPGVAFLVRLRWRRRRDPGRLYSFIAEKDSVLPAGERVASPS